MKKKLILFLGLFVFTFCISIGNVDAYHKDTLNYVSNGSAVKVCQYYSNANEYAVEVYYMFHATGANGYPIWFVYYRNSGLFGWSWEGGADRFIGNGINVFGPAGRIHFQTVGERFSNADAEFYCTKEAFIDTNAFHEVCFTDSMSCGSNAGTSFSHGPYPLVEDGSTIFEEIKNYATKTVYSDANFKNAIKLAAKNGQNNTKAFVKSYTNSFVNKRYSFGTTYDRPKWVDTYIDKLFEHLSVDNTLFNQMKAENDKLMAEVKEEVQKEVEDQVKAGTLTQEQADAIVEKVETAAEQSFEEVIGVKPAGVAGKPSGCPECNSLLGYDMTKIVNNIFTTIQFAGPVLVVVLTILDLIKAVSAGTQEELKKSGKRFGQRAAAAILLFFVPLICNLLFAFAGITLPEMCIGNEEIATKCVEDEEP